MHPSGFIELRDLVSIERRSGHAKEFVESMKEVHESIKTNLQQIAPIIQGKVDYKKGDLEF